MAAPYQTNFPLTVDNEGQLPDNLYVDPSHQYHDRELTPERIDSAMDRTAQYVAGLNPDVHSYSRDDHSRHSHHHHHNHQHDARSLPPLTIRRHTPGSNDPTLQKFPINLQPSSDNITSPSNVHVTIKRNPIPPDQTVIQPVLYPVAVYVNSPVPQYPGNPLFSQYPVNPPFPQYPANPPFLQYPINQPIQPMKAIKKPPTPKKPISPIKTSPTPPISPNRYETESFHSPSSLNKNRNISPRRPVRTDSITPSSPKREPQRVRSGQVIIEEYDDYEEQYHKPTVYTVPRKVISYRTAPGMTTRELENDEMDKSGGRVYVESPRVQTVTYRT